MTKAEFETNARTKPLRLPKSREEMEAQRKDKSRAEIGVSGTLFDGEEATVVISVSKAGRHHMDVEYAELVHAMLGEAIPRAKRHNSELGIAADTTPTKYSVTVGGAGFGEVEGDPEELRKYYAAKYPGQSVQIEPAASGTKAAEQIANEMLEHYETVSGADEGHDMRSLIALGIKNDRGQRFDVDQIKAVITFAERGISKELGAIDPRNHYTEAQMAEMTARFAAARAGVAALRAIIA